MKLVVKISALEIGMVMAKRLEQIEIVNDLANPRSPVLGMWRERRVVL